MYKNFIKPLIDFVVALAVIILISPILFTITLLLGIVNKGQPFFFQMRPGKNGKIFRIIKFRTMTNAKDADGKLLPDSQRLTSVGKFVRKTSIDELPQLFNVVMGQMSFVGPRPLLPQYLEIYTSEQMKRHNVKPGITGWAQVNGRNAISWTQKFEYDLWYVNNQSFILDFKILFLTIKKVLISEGINTENMATTEPFNGDN
jgi:undecaprenyl phosphate N,N'-diacetylbacillosamine 1-phosphate transferase